MPVMMMCDHNMYKKSAVFEFLIPNLIQLKYLENGQHCVYTRENEETSRRFAGSFWVAFR